MLSRGRARTAGEPVPGVWFRPLRRSPDAAVRLVCFPHAGGAANFFQPLAQLMASQVDVVGVQYPGRQDRHAEPAIADIGELADRVGAVLPALADLPLAFLGHSMGAVVAFEVASRWMADGRPPPVSMIMSSRRAPSRVRAERLHLLADDQLVAEVAALGGADPAMYADPDVRQLILPTLRADLRAIETYRPAPNRPRLPVPLIVIKGEADRLVSLEEAHAWADHTSGPLLIKVISGGDHFYLHRFSAETAALISAALLP